MNSLQDHDCSPSSEFSSQVSYPDIFGPILLDLETIKPIICWNLFPR